MRASPTAEVSIIRRRRTLFGALVVRLFGRVIHRIVAAHLYRAHECNIITSLQLHDLAYYSELDLSRGGRESPVASQPHVEGMPASGRAGVSESASLKQNSPELQQALELRKTWYGGEIVCACLVKEIAHPVYGRMLQCLWHINSYRFNDPHGNLIICDGLREVAARG